MELQPSALAQSTAPSPGLSGSAGASRCFSLEPKSIALDSSQAPLCWGLVVQTIVPF